MLECDGRHWFLFPHGAPRFRPQSPRVASATEKGGVRRTGIFCCQATSSVRTHQLSAYRSHLPSCRNGFPVCRSTFSPVETVFPRVEITFTGCRNGFPTCRNHFPACKNRFPTCLNHFPGLRKQGKLAESWFPTENVVSTHLGNQFPAAYKLTTGLRINDGEHGALARP